MIQRKPQYWERRVSGEGFGSRLKGFGDHALVKQRGLRGSKLGPANEGRRLSDDERKQIEQQLRDKGTIS